MMTIKTAVSGIAILLVSTSFASEPASGNQPSNIWICKGDGGRVTYQNFPPAEKITNCRQKNLPEISISHQQPANAVGKTSGVATNPAKNAGVQTESIELRELKKQYNNGEPERIGGEKNYQKYLDRKEDLRQKIEALEKAEGKQ